MSESKILKNVYEHLWGSRLEDWSEKEKRNGGKGPKRKENLPQ
jgi:hypothetical protein